MTGDREHLAIFVASIGLFALFIVSVFATVKPTPSDCIPDIMNCRQIAEAQVCATPIPIDPIPARRSC